jgi:hypothetical protein
MIYIHCPIVHRLLRPLLRRMWQWQHPLMTRQLRKFDAMHIHSSDWQEDT